MKTKTMTICIIAAVLAFGSAAQANVNFNAWGVHGITTSDSGGGNISFPDGGTDYHWEDSWDGHIRTGGKSFYSTDYLNGQLVSAIDTLTWTDNVPAEGTPYVNVLVEYTVGVETYTAILAPNDDRNNGDWADMMAGHSPNDWDFYIYEGSDFSGDNEGSVFDFHDGGDVGPAGTDGTDPWCTYALYDDVKDMTIIGGGQQLCPATVTGGPGTANYSDRAANWAHWGGGAELDGLSFVWGAREVKDLFENKTPIISNIKLNGSTTCTIPEPSTMLMILGGAATCIAGILRRKLRK